MVSKQLEAVLCRQRLMHYKPQYVWILRGNNPLGFCKVTDYNFLMIVCANGQELLTTKVLGRSCGEGYVAIQTLNSTYRLFLKREDYLAARLAVV